MIEPELKGAFRRALRAHVLRREGPEPRPFFVSKVALTFLGVYPTARKYLQEHAEPAFVRLCPQRGTLSKGTGGTCGLLRRGGTAVEHDGVGPRPCLTVTYELQYRA